MSQSTDLITHVAANVLDYRVTTSTSLAILVLILHEHQITFDEEVNLFWKRSFSGASALFFANRYLGLLVNFYLKIPGLSEKVILSQYPPGDIEACHRAVIANQLVDVILYLPYAAFSALRVYALSNRQILVSVLVFVLSCGPFAINLARIPWLSGYYDDIVGGCKTSLALAPRSYIIPLICASRIPTIIADIIVIGFIAHAAQKTQRLRTNAGKLNGPSFIDLLLRDGSIIFIVLLLLNSLHFTLSALNVATINSGGASQVTDFTTPIMTILTSRSLLNLQQLDRRVIESTFDDVVLLDTRVEEYGSLRFAANSDCDSPVQNDGSRTLTDPRSHSSDVC